MNFDIAKHTIFLTLHGSHAYGMSNENSDVDVKGIAISPKEYYTGFINKFNQFEGVFPKDYIINGKTYVEILEELVDRKIPEDEKIDSVIFDIKKFFYLASNCNPNIIEILFTDEKHHILKTKLGQKLLDNRELFLSQKAKFTFSGFAFSQLKRIKSHRAWLLHPIEIKPKRSDYGLPEHGLIPGDQRRAAEALIRRKIESWLYIPDELPKDVLSSVRENTINSMLDMWEGLIGDCYIKKEDEGKTLFEPLQPPLNDLGDFDTEKLEHPASISLGFDSNFIQALDMERRYKGALRNYNQYQEWKKNRNPKRAELEAKYSFDCKHASHLARLLRMCNEIITLGEVNVCRSDADELLAIRNGAWTYDYLINWAEEKQKELDEFYESNKSPLPKSPNINKIDELCQEIVEESLKGE